jgi:hypothetical protein
LAGANAGVHELLHLGIQLQEFGGEVRISEFSRRAAAVRRAPRAGAKKLPQ